MTVIQLAEILLCYDSDDTVRVMVSKYDWKHVLAVVNKDGKVITEIRTH